MPDDADRRLESESPRFCRIDRNRSPLQPPRRLLHAMLMPLRSGPLRWLVMGVSVGAVSGLAAAGFFAAVEWAGHLLLHGLAGIDLPAPAGESLFHGPAGPPRGWVIPILTTAVGLLTGWLVQRFIPDATRAGTDGTDAMIHAFHQGAGRIRPRLALIRGLTSILTLGSGGSAGREGPISQICAGLGSYLAVRLGLSARERRILLLAGAAGGLGAIFRAPLGGALTAIEVIYQEDFEAEATLPALVSSVTAYTIFTFFFGFDPIFLLPQFSFQDIRELPLYGLLALVCAAAGWFYVKTFRLLKYQVFLPLADRAGLPLAAGLGGLAMGLFGWAFPQVLSGGYGWLELAILGKMTVAAMIAVGLGKTLATSLTIGSGLSGGMFAPALFVGGMCGGAVGFAGHALWPQVVHQPGGYVLVGMSAFFSGVAKAPLGPLVMVCELTRGYGLLAPLMLASAISIALTRRANLYEHQVANKFASPAHVHDATMNVLEGLTVGQTFTPGRTVLVEESVTLKALADIIAGTTQLHFPVTGRGGGITGLLSIHHVRPVLFEEALFDLVVARDLAGPPASVTPDEDLYAALLKFVDTGYGQIPVVDPADPGTVLGLLNRDDVFKAYAAAIRTAKSAE